MSTPARLVGTPLLVALPGLFALAASFVAALLLPIWAWDSLGYHLPIVYDAIDTAGLRWVPSSIPYLRVYPKAAEYFYIFYRLPQADDTLLDFAQAPFAVGVVLTIASFAVRSGGSWLRALAYGVAYLAVPLVALQLATDYVDIAYAAALLLAVFFLTAEIDARTATLGALALGLLLSTKPTAPPSVAILSLFYLVRCGRAKRLPLALSAIAAAALLGGESYVRTFARYGNPIFPVHMTLGPFTLPGEDAAGPMFVQGLPEPYKHYPLPARLFVSWFVEPFPPVYDMRLGGLGVAFAFVLLPATFWFLARRRGAMTIPAALVFACGLSTPAAHWSRFTLALPAVLLALTATEIDASPRAHRWRLDLALCLASSIGLFRAFPGFTGGGPSLYAFARMSPATRLNAIGVDRGERDWNDAKARLAPGDVVAYDASFSLPGRLARPDGTTHVEYLDDALVDAKGFEAWVDARALRLLVAGDERLAGRVARANPARYRPLFRCIDDPCVVYWVEPTPRLP